MAVHVHIAVVIRAHGVVGVRQRQRAQREQVPQLVAAHGGCAEAPALLPALAAGAGVAVHHLLQALLGQLPLEDLQPRARMNCR